MNKTLTKEKELTEMSDLVTSSWSRIAPFWPLKNLIAVNPLSGFDELPFEEALKISEAYFRQKELPEPMHAVNRETIKWLQAFLDNGQSTIAMPLRPLGLLKAFRRHAMFDTRLHGGDKTKKEWLKTLPESASETIEACLAYLNVAPEHRLQFMTLVLTTLPGWAGHIQYRTAWADQTDANHPYPVSREEFSALRLIITSLLWPGAGHLLEWHQQVAGQTSAEQLYHAIVENENKYRIPLLQRLSQPVQRGSSRADAQLVFCIDVRSEPFRRAVEAQGNYETLGFAGFFGVPVSIANQVTGESYASCPVLLKPKHEVQEAPKCAPGEAENGHKALQGVKRLYQSLKYTFTAPFALVETIGSATGAWMVLRTLFPSLAQKIKSAGKEALSPSFEVETITSSIPLSDQIAYGKGALQMMGLTENFAPLVVFCGHGSSTQNNAFATALDCGACGGRHGAPNARILAQILNRPKVRAQLKAEGIHIPEATWFLAAEHNTTTDQVELYAHGAPDTAADRIERLTRILARAAEQNNMYRAAKMDIDILKPGLAAKVQLRSKDWAQVRPEWGLAGNAAFVVGPRSVTKDISLKGRCFLHSYDWQKDPEGQSLSVILTAPMVVAHWINSQYFFSTLDNVAFGAGSKVTKNITGKIGVMQGNASDLMSGLPLQSVHASDSEPFHEALRLMTVAYAPRQLLEKIIDQQPVLKKLFGNGWVTLACVDPVTRQHFTLNRNLTWSGPVQEPSLSQLENN